MCELTVIAKDEEKTLRKKFLIYDLITLNDPQPHPLIKACIDQVLENFIGKPDSIRITINIQIE